MKRNQFAEKMKSLVLFVMVSAMIFGTITISYGASYSDVSKTNWAFEAVNAMSGKGIIKGYPNGSFLPNNTVTYGEFIKMALVAGTSQDVGNASAPDHWAMNYYSKALELKYFTDHDINKAQLSNQIPRGDMALIVSSILGDVKIENYDQIQKGIKDVTYQTKNEYDITKAYATGVLTGYSDNTFKPEKTLSRAEAATVIYRLMDESKRIIPKGEGNPIPIEKVITNIDSFKNPGDGSINKWLAAAETYEIEKDGAKYGMTLKENRGTTWIAIPATSAKELHQIYLMKDGKIVEFTARHPNADGSSVAIYDSDIAKIDYIVSLDTIANKALLIVNPFKK